MVEQAQGKTPLQHVTLIQLFHVREGLDLVHGLNNNAI